MNKSKKLSILFIISTISIRFLLLGIFSYAYSKHTNKSNEEFESAIEEQTNHNRNNEAESDEDTSEDSTEGDATSNIEIGEEEDNDNDGEDTNHNDSSNQANTSQDDQDSQEQEEEQNNDGNDTPSPPPPSPDPITVLCLGDSVTKGHPYEGTSNTYPGKLQIKLDNTYGTNEYNVINQGVNGYRADQVLANVSSWLTQHNPDIVLLMVGGNDLNQDLSPESTYEEIASVINQTANETAQIVNICNAHTNPDSTHPKVIVSAFIPNNLYDFWGSSAIALYNSALSSKGFSNYFTSNWTDFYDGSTMQAKTSLMSDSTHPNVGGYSVMAQNWFERI